MGDSEYSPKGFPIRLLETPPIAQHTRTAFQPTYVFGFVLDYDHITQILEIPYDDNGTFNWLLQRLEEEGINVDDDEVTVHQLDDIGLDLIGSFFVYFAENSDARGLEQAQNRDLIEKLLRVVKQKESDAVWLLCDRHA